MLKTAMSLDDAWKNSNDSACAFKQIILQKRSILGSDGATLILGLMVKTKQVLSLRFSPKKQENSFQ